MAVKIAVIMTGHPRMVSYGNKLLQLDQADFPDTEITIFSNVWNCESDIKSEFKQLSKTDIAVLNSLKYHRVQNQTEFMDKIYNDYGIKADRVDFTNKAAQFLGMLDALTHWENELSDFDYIIKSRWDQVLDSASIKHLIKDKPTGFFNKTLYLNKGNIEISGNTIFGDSKSWFLHFMPMAKTMNLINQYLSENNNLSWPAHSLLGYVFQQTKASVAHIGEELGMRSHLLEIPIENISKPLVIGLSCPQQS